MGRRITVIIMTTTRCNLSCKYCYISNSLKLIKEKRGLYLDIKDVSRLIHNCSLGFEGVEFCWHGGEPLLVGKNFYEEVIRIQEKEKINRKIEYRNLLQTNGVLINEEWLNFLKENKFGVGLSFDAPPDAHTHYRQLYTNNTLETWEKMKQMKISHGVICVVSKLNVNKGKEIFDFFKEIKVDSYSLLPLRYIPTEECPDPPDNDGLFNLYRTTFELWAKNPNSIKSIEPINTMIRGLLGQRPSLCSFAASCPKKMITVDEKGNVIPCSSLAQKKFIIGNIFEEPLIKILSSSYAKKYTDLRVQSVNYYCRGCKFLSICRGGCRADAYWHSETYDGKYPYCEARKKTFEYLQKELGRILK